MKLLFEEGGLSKLIISGVKASDMGMYLCSASNCVGVDSSSCMVSVAAPTGSDSHLVLADVAEEKMMVGFISGDDNNKYFRLRVNHNSSVPRRPPWKPLKEEVSNL